MICCRLCDLLVLFTTSSLVLHGTASTGLILPGLTYYTCEPREPLWELQRIGVSKLLEFQQRSIISIASNNMIVQLAPIWFERLVKVLHHLDRLQRLFSFPT